MSSRMNVDHLTTPTVPDDGIELPYDADTTNTSDSEDSAAQFQTVEVLAVNLASSVLDVAKTQDELLFEESRTDTAPNSLCIPQYVQPTIPSGNSHLDSVLSWHFPFCYHLVQLNGCDLHLTEHSHFHPVSDCDVSIILQLARQEKGSWQLAFFPPGWVLYLVLAKGICVRT